MDVRRVQPPSVVKGARADGPLHADAEARPIQAKRTRAIDRGRRDAYVQMDVGPTRA